MNTCVRSFITAGAALLLCFFATTVRADVLYVSASFTQDLIERFTSSGVRSNFATSSSGLNVPERLAFDSADNLYMINATDNADTATIKKFTPDGVGSIFISIGLLSPNDLAFDGAGNLYVSNDDNRIEKYTSDGAGSIFADYSDGLRGPLGLALDTAGNLYAANFNSSIVKITPDGVGSNFGNTRPSTPLFLAFTDDAGVPLPLANQRPSPSLRPARPRPRRRALPGLSRPRRRAVCA